MRPVCSILEHTDTMVCKHFLHTTQHGAIKQSCHGEIMNTNNQNEIILYQPDNSLKLEVRLESETVWLTQAQTAELFQTTKQNLSLHINNIFTEGELALTSTVKEYLTVQNEGIRQITRKVRYYNLDIIISVGYRVKSQRGTFFRQWANRVLKDYLLRGYAINQRIERIEHRVTETEKKIDFFVRTSLPPAQGVFFKGQIFDAYTFAADLVKSAKHSLVLLDNYVDESVLLLLAKRRPGVAAKIYTEKFSRQLQLDVAKHNAQYALVDIVQSNAFHDRFLMVDDTAYLIGASIKDLGKKLFAFSKMEIKPTEILEKLTTPVGIAKHRA